MDCSTKSFFKSGVKNQGDDFITLWVLFLFLYRQFRLTWDCYYAKAYLYLLVITIPII